ncbi:plastid-specific ribosomal protein 3 [Chloropicon primus]|nr:plastid-specific ribosomal protein 3 [Chloropicon primus]
MARQLVKRSVGGAAAGGVRVGRCQRAAGVAAREAGRRAQTREGTLRKGLRATAVAEDASGGMFEGMGETSPPTFRLKFVWGKDTLAFAVDQILGKGNSSPLTEYFFWPQDDAWENLKAVLEAKDWIPASEKIAMLNRVTEVINFWTPQEAQEQNTTDQAKAKFPECGFTGTFY